MSITHLESLIEDLQTRVSFQEDSLAQLDDVISRQDQEILELKAVIKRLSEQFKEAQVGMAEHKTNERPPHY